MSTAEQLPGSDQSSAGQRGLDPTDYNAVTDEKEWQQKGVSEGSFWWKGGQQVKGGKAESGKTSQSREAERGDKNGVGEENGMYLRNTGAVELTSLVLEWSPTGSKR